jgi:cytochrome P450
MTEGATQSQGCPVQHDDAALLNQSLIDPGVYDRPNDYYRALRLGDPVHFDEKLGMYLVSRYEDLKAVLRDAVTYSQRKGWDEQFGHGYFDELKAILIRDGGGFFPETLLMDPPEHGRIRRLILSAFSSRRVMQLEPEIRGIVAELVEGMAEKGEADGVDFASAMSTKIICRQVGFDYDEVGRDVIGWGHAYVAQVSRMQSHEEMLRNAQLICDAQNYIIARINERLKEPREDMISDLISARIDDDDNPTLSFAELVATTRGLLNAGNETTATTLGNLLRIIATRPDLADQLYNSIDDDARVAAFIEEALRIEPPVRGLPRITTKEVELGGKRLPAGAHILMLFASANDDENVFQCPRTFDAGRANVTKHFSFGGGIHLCAGMALARMELKVSIQEIMRRLKDIRLAVPADQIRYRPGIASLTLESLPLKFARR